MNLQKKHYVKLLWILAILLIGLYALSWLYGHGRIVINLPQGTKTISIQDEEKTKYYTTDSAVFNKILPTKNYLITVVNESFESDISVQPIGRFLNSTEAKPNLKLESGRSFVGDNPNSCTEFIRNVLVSFPCNGPLESMTMHVPATNSTPSYTKNVKTTIDQKLLEEVDPLDVGVIEGVINNGSDELLVLTYKLESGKGFHSLYSIKISDNAFSVKFIKPIESLPENVVFKSKINEDKILLYDSRFTAFFSGGSFDTLQRFYPNFEQKEGYFVNHVDIGESFTLISYEEELEKFNEIAEDNQKTIISIVSESLTKEETLLSNIENLQLCGAYVCALDTKGDLIIYSPDLKKLTEFSEVLEYTSKGNVIFIAKDTEVLQINQNEMSGFIAMNLGQYKFSGLSINDIGVVVAINSRDKSHALLLSTEVADFPDKDVWPLLNNSIDYIDTASIYGNRVFISPNLGEREYIPDTGTYDYSPQKKNEVRVKINDYTKQIGLDNSKYNVKINNL
jgi:hypothetical protein